MNAADAEEAQGGTATLSHIEMLGAQRRVFEQLDWWPVAQMLAHTQTVADAGVCVAPVGPAAQVAWLRWAAVRDGVSATAPMRELIERQCKSMAAAGIASIGCICPRLSWLRLYLADNGFRRTDAIVTLIQDTATIQEPDSLLNLRSCADADLTALEILDTAAFAAPWRYSARLLRRAMDIAALMDVALLDSRLVGYVCGNRYDDAAHVVRLVVDPRVGQRGVGRAMLRHAASMFRKMGANHITLNTPASLPALEFYKHNGFAELRERVDVLMRSI